MESTFLPRKRRFKLEMADFAVKMTDFEAILADFKNEPRAIRTPNLLIWSQTRYRCAMGPIAISDLRSAAY